MRLLVWAIYSPFDTTAKKEKGYTDGAALFSVSCSESGYQMADFLIDMGRVLDRFCDFGAEKFAKTLTHSVDGHFDCALAQVERETAFGVRFLQFVASEGRLERVEKFGALGSYELAPQPCEHKKAVSL